MLLVSMARRVESADELLRRYGQGERDFENAELKQGHLRRANISGANLAGAHLRGADLCWANLTGANLAGAKLTSAELTGAKLRAANFRGARLYGADLSEADLREVDLCDADLRRANLSEASLSKANLFRADLTAANLGEADVGEVNLSMVNLRAARLHKGDFYRAKLSGADLSEADLSEADLSGADLGGADLRHANLSGANLSEANLINADLSHAELQEANLDGAALDSSTFNPGPDLLAAQWGSLTISDVAYFRDAVERGEQSLPIGQSSPLRFVFAIDGKLGSEDLQALREFVRNLHSAEGTAIALRITGKREVLVVEGVGTATQAGRAGLLLQLVQHVLREGIEDELEQPPEAHRHDPSQQLLLLARAVLEQRDLVRLLGRLQFRELVLRDEDETKKLRRLIRDWQLDEQVAITERTATFSPAFVVTPEATGLLLGLLGLGRLARVVRASMERLKPAQLTDSEFKDLMPDSNHDVG
jgi:uncharacterized protein YjbI with pentapeptide repeats